MKDGNATTKCCKSGGGDAPFLRITNAPKLLLTLGTLIVLPFTRTSSFFFHPNNNNIPRASFSRSSNAHSRYSSSTFLSPKSDDEKKPNPIISESDGQSPVKDNFSAPFSTEDQFIERQVQYSSSVSPAPSDVESKSEYLIHQREVFDSSAEFFSSSDATPPEIVPVLKHIVRRFFRDVANSEDAGLKSRKREFEADDAGEGTDRKKVRILDVACGTGALFPYFQDIGVDHLGLDLEIVGVDLSPNMVEKAKERVDGMGWGDRMNVRVGDFAELSVEEVGEFDGIIMNACFANFYDLDETVTAATKLLKLNGVLAITHPLGSSFVLKLHTEDAKTVPHTLPDILQFRNLLRYQPLAHVDYIEEVNLVSKSGDGQPETNEIYYTSARKVPHRALSQILRFRGKVSAGYGRGGKKLGVPTANLSEEQFGKSLEDVDTGVYFGWAVVENPNRNVTKTGRNVYQKAVVNVGYSPTFVGEENKKKIIEAHLIMDGDETTPMGDFYNETMRLALSGFLRPEMKFPSFPDLIAQINYDIECAKEALTMQPFAGLRTDVFLVDPCRRVNVTDAIWVGKGGGNETASWEFMDQEEVLKNIPLGRFL